MTGAPHKYTLQTLSIWSFVDPIEFLRRVYEVRKEKQRGFSYQVWAQELGLKSRSFLRLVLIGKRSLTGDLAIKLIQNLNLKKQEAQFFMHLVQLQRACDLQTQEYHSREISNLRQKFLLKSHSIVELPNKDYYEFLSNFRIPRLQVLLGMSDILKTSNHLASLLQVKESETIAMLETLRAIGLAVCDEKSEWSSQSKELGTMDELGNIALQSFHRKSLEEAIVALSSPTETRRYQTAVLALTPEQFLEIHKEMRQIFEDLLKKYDDASSLNKKIYQLNMNLIPVTRPIDRAHLRETAGNAQKEKDT